MLAVLAPLIVFGLVIFIHELGHFIAAKLVGVYAPRFSIGFGPALFKRRRGETEYVLAALPLGGYVRMASRHDAETAFMEGGAETEGLKPGDAGYDPEAMMPFGPKPVPESRWFESQSLAARLFIMIAGVVMNVILAFVIFTVLNVVEGEPVIATRVVGAVHAPVNAPALAQLRMGDTILAVNGQPVRHWSDVLERIDGMKPGTLVLHTNRGDVSTPVGKPGAPSNADVIRAVDFYTAPVIGELMPGGPASRAGLREGDTVLTIAHQPVRAWSDLQDRVRASANVDLPFEVKRKGRVLSLTVRPEASTERDPDTKVMQTIGRIGATTADFTARQPLSAGAAIAAGVRQTWITATKVGDVVKGLVTRQVSVKQLGGPIAITRASVSAAQGGLATLFILVALISVNVAVLNLLPIPILDGGQILINVVESVKGSPLSERTRENILKVGLAAILVIFALSTYNDVVNVLRDKFGHLFG